MADISREGKRLKPCLRCKGNKTITNPGFESLDGVVYPEITRKCYACDGVGEYSPLDENQIRKCIFAGQGKNKGKLRASLVSPKGKDMSECRAYYVWRLARFHGGKDTTQPVVADMVCSGDPFRPELDILADKVAKESFGTNLAAAFIWGKALGMI